jgi:YidC/Oxa1 family membrane protein insertase
VELLNFLWTQVLIDPMTNALVVLSNVFFGSFGVAIIVFTIIMRGITFPLTLRQLRSSRSLSALQPKIRDLQKKYTDPKRRSEETMKLYREAGVNPLGCFLPMVVQMPIWFALYRVIQVTLGSTPESLMTLSHRLYPWSYVQHSVPLGERFLWLNLGERGDLLLALLVGVSMYVQQKMTTPVATDERQQSMNSTMLWMMPLMFVFFSLQVPNGLPLYWFMSGVVSIVLQYTYMGSNDFSWRSLLSLQPATARKGGSPAGKPAAREEPAEEEETTVDAGAERRYKKRSRHGRRRRKR